MNSENQKQICHFLLDNGIENIIGVPDSTLKHFIAESLKLKNVLLDTTSQAHLYMEQLLFYKNHVDFLFQMQLRSKILRL